MAVKIGSARIDENGKAHGGKAGDQTGKEVSTQNWYRYKKSGKYVDWRVMRFKSPELAERNAVAMEHACANPLIGYDQYQRDSLLSDVASFGYDPAKTTKSVETDCSALERVCIAYAVKYDVIGNYLRGRRFSTANMCEIMLETGLFEELKGEKYAQSSDYLKRGDILCTAVQAHVVTVLSDGAKVAREDPDELRKGDKGDAVVAMQNLLLCWDKDCLPQYGADGDFGTETQKAIKAFQGAHSLALTGIYDAATRNSLAEATSKRIVVTGDRVNIRSIPSIAGKIIAVAKRGEEYPCFETNADGWHRIRNGWISGNYTKEI